MSAAECIGWRSEAEVVQSLAADTGYKNMECHSEYSRCSSVSGGTVEVVQASEQGGFRIPPGGGVLPGGGLGADSGFARGIVSL